MAKSILLFCFFSIFTSYLFPQNSTISIQNMPVYQNDSLIVPIMVTNFTNVGALTLKIQYDSNSLLFSGIENWDSQFAGALSGNQNKTIILAWDGLNPVNLVSGKLADLKFFHKTGDCVLSFVINECEVADINGKAIKVDFTGGIITSIPVPAIPNLNSPANNTKELPAVTMFSWNTVKDAQSYTLQIAADQNFQKVIFNDSTINISSKQVNILKQGEKYFWRVNARNISGSSPYSDVRNFSTLLPAPEKLAAFVVADRKIRLAWTDNSDNESGFILERKLAADISYAIVDTLRPNLCEYNDSTLKPGTAYKYRIVAFTPFTASQYSNEVTVTTTSVKDLAGNIPCNYFLFQNYPNPFNPNTIIKYSLPVESSITLKIVNILGETVYMEYNVQSQGNYEIIWNAGNFTSGIYYCFLEAKSLDGAQLYRSVNKMLLLK